MGEGSANRGGGIHFSASKLRGGKISVQAFRGGGGKIWHTTSFWVILLGRPWSGKYVTSQGFSLRNLDLVKIPSKT